MVNPLFKKILTVAVPLAIVSLFLLSSTGLITFDFEGTKSIAIALSSNEQGIDGNLMILPQNLITGQCYFETKMYIHNVGTETIQQIEVGFLAIGDKSGNETIRRGYIQNLEPGKSVEVMLTDGGKSLINMEEVLAYNCNDENVLLVSVVRIPEIDEAIFNEIPVDVTDTNIFNKAHLIPLSQYEIKKEI